MPYSITEATKHPVDRDRLLMVDRGEAADGAQLALFQIQDLKPDVALASVAVLFAVLTAGTGTNPEEAYHLGRKVLTDQDFHDRANKSLQSLRDFAGIRMAGREDVSVS